VTGFFFRPVPPLVSRSMTVLCKRRACELPPPPQYFRISGSVFFFHSLPHPGGFFSQTKCTSPSPRCPLWRTAVRSFPLAQCGHRLFSTIITTFLFFCSIPSPIENLVCPPFFFRLLPKFFLRHNHFPFLFCSFVRNGFLDRCSFFQR